MEQMLLKWPGDPQETTGLMGMFALWILGKPYNLEIERLNGMNLYLLKHKRESVVWVTKNLSKREIQRCNKVVVQEVQNLVYTLSLVNAAAFVTTILLYLTSSFIRFSTL